MTGSPGNPGPDGVGPDGVGSDGVGPDAGPEARVGRPYIILSCAMSLDGHIDDCSPRRLLLSNDADLDRVDEVRAGCDAILVGAGTVRRDNPRLAVRSPERRAARSAAGRPPTPLKATLTRSASLDPTALFFGGDVEKVVYCAGAPGVAEELRRRLSAREPAGLTGTVTVVDLGGAANLDPVAGLGADVGSAAAEPILPHMLADLSRRGVRRLLVEGGTSMHTAFLTAGLVDELHLVVAPFFVGDAGAPTFVGPGSFPYDARHRLHLAEVRQIGDVALLRYLTRRPAEPLNS